MLLKSANFSTFIVEIVQSQDFFVISKRILFFRRPRPHPITDRHLNLDRTRQNEKEFLPHFYQPPMTPCAPSVLSSMNYKY